MWNKRDNPSIWATPSQNNVIKQEKRIKATSIHDTNDALEKSKKCTVVYIFRTRIKKKFFFESEIICDPVAQLEPLSQVTTSDRVGRRRRDRREPAVIQQILNRHFRNLRYRKFSLGTFRSRHDVTNAWSDLGLVGVVVIRTIGLGFHWGERRGVVNRQVTNRRQVQFVCVQRLQPW